LQRKNLIYIDVKNLVTIKELEDGLHPNSLGHGKMFDKIKPEIEKLIIE